MCIAIVKTKDGMITDEQLRNCFESNPHGAGIAYTVNNELYYIKGIFDVDEFINAVRYAESEADSNMLIHCRISTSGLIDETNCHPHIVNEDCVMIHNGVLKIEVPKDSKVSDTVIFVEQILSKLPKNFMYDKAIMMLIQMAIGSNNKFCFLYSNGDYAIVNEDEGIWEDGVWYSNDSYDDFYSLNSYKYGSVVAPSSPRTLYELTGREWIALEEYIRNLTPQELIKIGYDPVYDFATGKLSKEDRNREMFETEEFLMDLSDFLYEVYTEQYTSAVDSYYDGSVEVDSFDTDMMLYE